MCGIVGYVGKRECGPILVEGLKALEYRGYDSVGVAILNKSRVNIVKNLGRIESIKDEIIKTSGTCGIGHTRWATHGKPSKLNSHPHASGKFAVVHNGIIENCLELKIELVNKGVKFESETDTEVIAHLLNENYNGNLIYTLKKIVKILKGSYALAVLCEDYDNAIAVVKKDSPLVIGYADGEYFIASDIPAISSYTDKVVVLKDDEMALITAESVVFYDDNMSKSTKVPQIIDVKRTALEKGNYESYMLKEMSEIPSALKYTFEYLESSDFPSEFYEAARRSRAITIIGCGTAYNSGIAAKYAIETLCRIPVNVEIASEYRYRNPILNKGELVIAVSQSGETADTIAAVKLAKSMGAYICVITNTESSSLTTIADCNILTKAGVEIAVAATKSYNCQLMTFYYIALKLAEQFNGINIASYLEELQKIPYYTRQLCVSHDELKSFAGHFSNVHSVFFLGRGMDYAVAVEGSLKLKEISYIHSEGYAAGELKHGTLALIEKDTLVVILNTQKELLKKTANALHEVKAREATIFVLSQYAPEEKVDFQMQLPATMDIFMPLIEIIPLQYFAYYMSRSRGCDPDKPRNLAKSVTVE